MPQRLKNKCRNGIHKDQKKRMLGFVTKNHIIPLNEFLSCVAKNIKISTVRSLADICFLHVLYRYSYCVIQLGVSVTQYALIACIYKLLSVSCSSFGSANATRYSTVLLFLCCGFYFQLFCVSPSVWRFWSFELDLHETCGHVKE